MGTRESKNSKLCSPNNPTNNPRKVTTRESKNSKLCSPNNPGKVVRHTLPQPQNPREVIPTDPKHPARFRTVKVVRLHVTTSPVCPAETVLFPETGLRVGSAAGAACPPTG